MIKTNLSRERISIDGVFRSELVVKAVMYVDLMELVLVRQRTASDVNVVSRLVLHGEYYGMARVGDEAINLVKEKNRL